MDIFKKYRQDNNKKALLKALKAHFQIKKIHKSIEPYIFGEVPVEGIFSIDTFEDRYQRIFTYDKLFYKLGSGIFPAVLIGGETYGVDFWLVMTNGKVISLHHDASFSEVAYDIETDNADYFVKEFSRQGSIFTIKTLLEFQRLSLTLGDEDGPDYERNLIEITAQSLGRSLGWLSQNIWRLPLEPVRSRTGEFLEENGLKDLILAEKKVAKFNKRDTEKADLSFCFLKTIPEILSEKQQLLQLNLSGNPLTIQDELVNTQLKKLELADCQLTELPKLPTPLEYLDIGENDITDLRALQDHSQLKYLGLINNPISEAAIAAFKRSHPGCFVAMESANFDFESDSLDLSFKKLRKLPKEIAKFKDLRHLNLWSNPKLNFVDVFNTLADVAPNLQTLNLQQCKLTELPDEIFKLQSLEKLILEGPKYLGDYRLWNDLDFNTYFAKLHRLPNLKYLPLRGRTSGYRYPTDEPAYLENLKQYKSLKVLDFPEDADEKPAFFSQILEIAKTLPVDTFVWDDFNFRVYGPNRYNYEVLGLDQLTKIKHLVWNCNHKDEFASFVFDFPNLETLDVSKGGEFPEIPDDIARLSQLKKFKLHCGNYDLIISPKIGELHNLEELELRIKAHEFPESLGQLSQLKKLTIRESLRKVPESITQLHQLEELNLAGNAFEELPTGIVQLQNLEVLDLHECKYVELLPDDLGRLSKLKKLNIRDMDRLKALPSSLDYLQNLEELEFSGKRLDYVKALEKVAQLSNLRKLEMIDIDNKMEFYIPESLAQLENLRYLYLYHSAGMKDLNQAFEVFAQLPNLEHFNMSFYWEGFSNNIPNALGKFKKLKTIDIAIRDCSISQTQEFFVQLAKIPTLKKINANRGMAYLPPEISLLKNLEELCLSSNPIKTYPKSLLEMTWLKKLDLYATDLSSADKQLIKKSLPYTEVEF